ncbi:MULTISPECIES: DUF3369 domain-containing protein [Chromobacterium]|uniref:DUF3369 domain-containing protein n=1 Tax=Chromobacterium TaxID=535 RepID=UPI0005BAEEDA|nr:MULTISPECIES: DUF3369 domain-containing protein [Chromobacterium]QOZ85298.1 DUF3369 domain-containing protein [Chromobacterium sp. Rain0013]WON85510.1 DUF3369 domain-containing protein [Chromobacterium haemolyticum]
MSDITNQEDDWLLDDDAPAESAPAVSDGRHPWKILIVDDEKDVHTATRIALRNIRYKERPLELLSAHSGKEAYEVVRQHPDIALIMLDVVMESEDAGLKLVHQIRQDLKNGLVRIVLRTGQPGQAPEQEVILNYDINDYKTKTELTVQKLFTTIISSLRAYENLLSLEKNRQGLSKILESASDLYQLYSLREFASGVLRQISALLDIGSDGILCVRNDNSNGRPELEILAASGNYESLGQSGDLSPFPELEQVILRSFAEKRSIYQHPYDVLYITSRNGREFIIHFTPQWPLEEVERDLLDVFCQRISAAYDNLYLYSQLRSAQEATVVALADLAEFRDSDTGNHVLRVQRLTDAIAGQMRDNGAYPELMSKEFMDMVGMASILHDVGKVGTPDHILFKPGKLDPDERVIMEQHATIGAQILARSASMVEGMSYLSLGSEIAGGHHEHFDGNGYPRKQKAHEIPLSARIVAVVDVFDALLNKRPYKEPWTLRDTMDYISGRAGSQFDPEVVRALETLVKERRLQDLPDE